MALWLGPSINAVSAAFSASSKFTCRNDCAAVSMSMHVFVYPPVSTRGALDEKNACVWMIVFFSF